MDNMGEEMSDGMEEDQEEEEEEEDNGNNINDQ
jgi:hypothetical protein